MMTHRPWSNSAEYNHIGPVELFPRPNRLSASRQRLRFPVERISYRPVTSVESNTQCWNRLPLHVHVCTLPPLRPIVSLSASRQALFGEKFALTLYVPPSAR